MCTAHSRRRFEQTLEMQSSLCPTGGARDLFSKLESGSASRGHPHPRTPAICSLLESPAAFDLLRRQPHGLVSRSCLELKSLVLLGPRVVPNPRLTTPVVPHLLGQHGLSYCRGKMQGRRWGETWNPKDHPPDMGTQKEWGFRDGHTETRIRSRRSVKKLRRGKSRSDDIISELKSGLETQGRRNLLPPLYHDRLWVSLPRPRSPEIGKQGPKSKRG